MVRIFYVPLILPHFPAFGWGGGHGGRGAGRHYMDYGRGVFYGLARGGCQWGRIDEAMKI